MEGSSWCSLRNTYFPFFQWSHFAPCIEFTWNPLYSLHTKGTKVLFGTFISERVRNVSSIEININTHLHQHLKAAVCDF